MMMEIDNNTLLVSMGGLVSGIVWMFHYTNTTIKNVVLRLESSIDNCEKEGIKKDTRISELEKAQSALNFEVGYLKGLHQVNKVEIDGTDA